MELDAGGRKVYLAPESEDSIKNRLLAPFFPRYRTFLELEREQADLRGPFRNLVMSECRRMLYVRNPKCACTSVMQLMFHLARGEYYSRSIHHASSGIILSRYYWKHIQPHVWDDQTVRFSLVRDPEARMYSAFKNFFIDQRNPARHKHMSPMRNFGFSEVKSNSYNYDVFLEYAASAFEICPLRVDAHWRLQTLNLGIGKIKFTHIGKVESFLSDVSHVFEVAGVEEFPIDLLHRNSFNRSKQSEIYITTTQRAKIHSLYREDYEAFNY